MNTHIALQPSPWRRWHALRAGLLLVAALAGPGAWAAPTDSADFVEQLRLARRLAAYAQANDDALAMLAAARVMAETGAARSRSDPQQPGEPLADAYFDRAEALARGRADLAALIADARAARLRHSRAGGDVRTSVVLGGGRLRVRLNYTLGQRARFGIDPDPTDSVTLRVLGPGQELLCELSTQREQRGYVECEWLPQQAGDTTILILNPNPRAVEVMYFHN
ncbi:hypothetical protein [Variovorax sp. YR752]|uniref:hypothetical protein n=1 Tax=Variovorax sp. YR752 TaxID=1884383 RepID=UPI003137E68E